jgi:lipoprotein NlpI
MNWDEKREYDRAIEDYTQALRLDPKDSGIYSLRAHTWHKKREYVRAIEDYTQVLRLSPKYPWTYSFRAGVWSDKREYDRAIEDYTEALRLSPENHDDYFSRGMAQFHAGRPELAAQDFDRALALEPGRHMYALWEYLALRRLGRDAAQALEHRATKLDLTQWPAPIVLLYQGKIAPATMLAHAGSGGADAAKYKRLESMFYLGHWHLMHGAREQAVRSFREALATFERLRTEFNAGWWLDAGGSLHSEFNAARVELLAMGERVD